MMKVAWKAHLDLNIREKLDKANNLLYGGSTEEALALFSEVVDEDPSYAEAWNRASTCEFMLGNLEASLAAAKRTVEIIPTHFQALNGMGLVYTDMKELPSAVENFRKGLELDPWSPVSSRLATSIETLKLSERLAGTTSEE
jgi:tetratricopeptide (TPR) repeat protein